MSEHVEKLSIHDGLHDYVQGMRAQQQGSQVIPAEAVT
jgi:hypothetical protein